MGKQISPAVVVVVILVVVVVVAAIGYFVFLKPKPAADDGVIGPENMAPENKAALDAAAASDSKAPGAPVSE